MFPTVRTLNAPYASPVPAGAPEIAVVIPTRGRREARLAAALEALAAQTLERDRFEVLVVRDPDVPAPLAPAPAGLTHRLIEAPVPTGAAAKRNLGWRATGAPLVAFTDDDCRPSPGWLEAVLASADGADVFVQGRTEPDPVERHDHWGLAHSQLIEGPSPWYETCNIAYPRSLLERLEGFDEAFPGLGGEDTDLGLRAERADARRRYAGEALVWHAVHPQRLGDALRQARQWGDLPLVLARHDEHRAALRYRAFLRESHARLLLAAAGIASRRPALAALAALPYLRLHLEAYPPDTHGRLRAAIDLPARALVDAVEIAVTARGALRHRAPML